MSTLVVGVLAVVVTASVTFLLGWWLGNRRRAAELQRYKGIVADCEATIDAYDQRCKAIVNRVVQTSLAAIRAQRER